MSASYNKYIDILEFIHLKSLILHHQDFKIRMEMKCLA